MQLNIYLISHPLTKILSNQIIYTSLDNNVLYLYQYNKLSLLLIYEATRKWLKIQTIYIHCLDLTKEINKFDNRESYVILADLINCGNLISNIKLIIPHIKIQHICFNKPINHDCLYNNISTIMKRQRIIIVKKFLDNYSILSLLDYLSFQKNIKTDQIRLVSVACNNSVLEQIGKKYPSLNIYTTKIYNS